ncbi:DUF5063 domain-containing protein [Pelomonas sp. UHG3]|uniref:DUF5063 domain-containing protein n=1 Tax=Roseateles hydrophilus TaxID=2975054 RepID=A0ACC6C733_9BURK|nr:DUF5063 domain-containing protein [Pelomonas sp. UHG3]MCY4744134.1 DUF5063 domain-containing protein [Pelomonas sp. UHG3]
MTPNEFQTVLDFAATARGFCIWCEDESAERTDVHAASWLARLYGLGVVLPSVNSDNEDGLPDLPTDVLLRVQTNLAGFSGRYYREVFDPAPELDDQPVIGDIGDDLLDTYKDVRRGLMLFDDGAVAEALWQWSFLHRVHWGRHCAGALLALHGLTLSNLD